jgi:hypothetical protein
MRRRIARIARSVPRHWFTTMRKNDAPSLWCGYQWPYSPENRAVVIGSFTGVQSSTHR